MSEINKQVNNEINKQVNMISKQVNLMNEINK